MVEPTRTDAARIQQRRETLDANVFSRLPALYAASRVQGRKLLEAGGGLSIVEWRTLWDLYQAGPMSIRDLAYVQRSDHSLLSRALPDMRRKGYITLARDADDGRQMIVALTDCGRQAYERAAPIMQRRRNALRERFTAEEIRAFIAFADRLDEFLHMSAGQLLEGELNT